MFTLLLSLYFGKLRAIHKPSQTGFGAENNGYGSSISLGYAFTDCRRKGQQVFPEKKHQSEIVSSLRPQGKGNGGGALSATCNAVAEIFKIAAIIPGLVLVGVAVGFVLLRVEAFLEESEE
nr:Cytochrome B6-F complex subunit 7 [Ipomoea batatas]